MLQKIKSGASDMEDWTPVIYKNIVSGRQVAGFKEIHTGEFIEVMLIRNSRDMDEFLEAYDISIAEIVVK